VKISVNTSIIKHNVESVSIGIKFSYYQRILLIDNKKDD
jgi:hypothetical protein